MNRNIYRLVKNQLGMWVVAPEHVRAQGKGGSKARKALLALVLVPLLNTSVAFADSVGLPNPCATCGGAAAWLAYGLASYQATGNTAIISQMTDSAILNWKDFNVASGNQVIFQRVADLLNLKAIDGAAFSTLNRIWDKDPSIIAGRIGTVANQQANLMFINQNGIIFANGAKVDVNTLTASSLNMTDEVFKNPGSISADAAKANARFRYGLDGVTENYGGIVKVMEGAQITTGTGGRVMLIAPTVTNRGEINTPNGQTILAAGSAVYLQASDSANLRGFLVQVDNKNLAADATDQQNTSAFADAEDKLGNASNFGAITAAKGNVTMVGLAVNQMGRATASTAYNANGSIFLHAVSDQGVNRTGKVTLGGASETDVLIDANDPTKALEAALTRSKVDVLGKEITVKSNAQVTVPSGIVNLTATSAPGSMSDYVTNLVAIDSKKPTTAFQATSGNIGTGAKVLVESGAKIDVSGLDATVSAQDNVLKIKLLGAELADSPANRSVLRGKEVYVDLSKGSPLIANLSEYQNKVEKTVVARSTDAGSVKIQSEDQAIVQSGAKFDLSAGKTTIVGGVVGVTKLVGADGKVYDISEASPTTQYVGLANEYVENDVKWGKTRTFSRSLSEFVPTYTAGGDAGLLLLNGITAYFGGDIDGTTSAGVYQLLNGSLPLSATFQLGNNKIGNDFGLKQNVLIDQVNNPLASNNLLTSDQQDNLHLSASLFGQGKVGRLELNTNKNVTINSAIKMADGGSVNINAAKVNVNADITTTKADVALNADLVRSDGSERSDDQKKVFYVANNYEDVLNKDVLTKSGSININATNNNDNSATNTPEITIAKNVTLQTSGYWINEAFGFVNPQPAVLLSAGDINLKADFKDISGSVDSKLVLEDGAMLDVRGGAAIDATGKTSFGQGGSVKLFATNVVSSQPLQDHLKGESFADAGTLSVTSDNILIGAKSDSALSLNTDFFKQGFANYEVKGLKDLTVAENANVVVQTKNLELKDSFATMQSNAKVDGVAKVVTLDETLRKAANLTLKATSRAESGEGTINLSGANTASVTIAKGAQITTDVGATVTIGAAKSVEIAGKINTPAGNITVTLDNGLGQADNTQRIHLTESAELNAAGTAKLFMDSKGLTKGEVLSGGKVSLLAKVGYVDTERGSLINVRGADPARVDLLSVGSNIFASDAGEVNIAGNTGVYLDGDFNARASGPAYHGGKISVALEATNINPNLVMHVGDFSNSFPNGVSPTGLQNLNDNKQFNQGYVNPLQLQNAGFESIHVTSNDTIVLENGASFGANKPLHSVQLNAANIISNTAENVRINADMVAMGNRELDGQSAATKSPLAGSGGLTVDAGYIELSGNTAYSGFSKIDLKSAGEVRLTGVQTATGVESAGKFDTQANLNLTANVVSPASLVTFAINSTGDIRFDLSPRSTDIKPLSALGNLTVTANNIEQNGRIVAPFGTIKLDATNSLKLNQGSVTSVVAGSGQVIPFGSTLNGKDWFFDKTEPNIVNADEKISTLQSKNIVLNGSKVNVNTGAVLDISSAGDLQASEFTVGTGGTADILEKKGYYAILPGYEGGVAPTDPLYKPPLPEDTEYKVPYNAPVAGQSVYLSGSNNLKAGNYVLLPAKYALLPGAFAIKVTDGVTDVLPSSNYLKSDGVAVVGGFLTDQRFQQSDVGARRWTGFELLTQDQVRARSEYGLTYASKFFANNADSAKVQDAGLLQIGVKSELPPELTLNGTINSKAAIGGKGAGLDISTDNKLALVSQSAKSNVKADEVALDIDQLNALKIDSLLIGGTRDRKGDKTTIAVNAKQVRVDNVAGQGEAALTGRELMLTAKDDIKLEHNAAIDAAGESGNAGTYEIKGDAAFVRAAATDAELKHTDTKSVTGNISADVGSRVTAAQSVMLDATKNNLFLGGLSKNDVAIPKNLLVSAGLINVGEVPSNVLGFNLDGATLNRFKNADALKLSSYSTIDFYGDATLGLKDDTGYSINNLTLQSAALRGIGNTGKAVTIQAKTLAFANPNNVNNALVGNGQAQLNLVADKFGLGVGDKAISGFSSINIKANEVVSQVGEKAESGTQALTGTLNLGANTQINTARMGGETGADQTINNTAALSVKQLPNTNLAASNTFGNSWSLKASTLNVDALMQTKGGNITLTATAGDVNLGQSATLDASSKNVAFFDVTKPVDAGVVTIKSDQGNVIAAKDARVDVSSSLGANAGTLNAQAINGTVDIAQATFTGNGSADSKGVEGKAGTLNVDAKTVANFDQLNQQLNAGDFTEKRDFRLRTGNLNLTQQATGTIKTIELTVAVDAGSLTVDNTIDASGTQGGKVTLFARDDVKLSNQANINASATANSDKTAEVEKGGEVKIGTSAGLLDLQGGVINVADSQGKESGEVLLRAPRTGNSVAVKSINTDIQGASSAVLEGVKVYENINTVNAAATSSGTQLSVNTILVDNTAFMNNKSSIINDLGAEVASLGNKFHLRGGAEVRSTGNMVVSQDISLYQANRSGGEPGALTLRANGDLTFNGSLSDGFTTAATTGLIDPNKQESWSYRLVAGADQSAANPLAIIQPTLDADGSKKGDFKLAENKLIRTGTGDIEIAAAGNFDLGVKANAANQQTGVIYTAGRIADTPAGFNYISGSTTNNRLPVNANNFTQDGGNISLNVAGDITGAATNQLYSNWLFRQGKTDDTGNFTGPQTAWWVRFDQFQQGIAALGGGDVNVNAGGAIKDLSVSSVTNGRMAAEKASEDKLVVLGGGDVNINAAGDIQGGQYYAAKGKLNVDAQSIKVSSRQTTKRQGSNPQDILITLPVYTTIALGDAQAKIVAKNDIVVNMINPTMVVQSYTPTNPSSFVDSGFNLYGNSDSKSTSFSTYTDDTAVILQSTRGNVTIGNDVANLLDPNFTNGLGRAVAGTQFGSTNIQNVLKVVPGTVKATAYNGDVDVTKDMYLYASPKGSLELLAQNNVNVSSGDNPTPTNVSIVMSDTAFRDFSDARGALLRKSGARDSSEQIAAIASNVLFHSFVNEEIKDENGNVIGLKPVAVRKNDTEAVKVYAVKGDVNGDTKATTFSNKIVVPKAIQVRAGNDFKNIGVTAQNMRDTDVSYIKAGRDILFATDTVQDDQQFKVGGPGRLDVESGRDIDLGSSKGIMTSGNRENSYLPDGGADIHIAVGVPNGIDYVGAIARLEAALKLAIATGQPISDSALWQAAWLVGNTSLEDTYTKLISDTNSKINLLDKDNTAAINQLISDTNEKISSLVSNEKKVASVEGLLASLQAFKAQPLAVQETRVRSMFYQALRDTGRDYNEPISPYVGQFNRGYDATELLFPGIGEKNADGTSKNYAGNLNFPLSTIKTVNGGNIEFMAPGGQALVGYSQISDPVLNLYAGYADGVLRDKTTTGMLTLGQGSIRGFTFGDVLVNQSRILTVGGGDILLWSSEGNLDAGKGKRTAVNIPPPIITLDKNGNVVVTLQGAATGSGIGALGDNAGDVDLLAPKGTIDAGDAGIRAKNVNLAAQTVLNAANITATGSASGTQVATAGALNGTLTGAAGAGDPSKAINDAVSKATQAPAEPFKKPPSPSFINVEVVSIGD